jgi:hypothetical protein
LENDPARDRPAAVELRERMRRRVHAAGALPEEDSGLHPGDQACTLAQITSAAASAPPPPPAAIFRRLWKWELQRLADQTGLKLTVCHFPPGTSKWNNVEYRLFSIISSNWRGEPLRDYETVVRLIAGTTTATGLESDLPPGSPQVPRSTKEHG